MISSRKQPCPEGPHNTDMCLSLSPKRSARQTFPSREDQTPPSSRLIQDLTQLLAEMRIEDFQADRRATVSFLPRTNRKILIPPLVKKDILH